MCRIFPSDKRSRNERLRQRGNFDYPRRARISSTLDRASERRSFLKLSIEERRQILAQQAEAALPYYEENKAEWEEWINLDIAETYAP